MHIAWKTYAVLLAIVILASSTAAVINYRTAQSDRRTASASPAPTADPSASPATPVPLTGKADNVADAILLELSEQEGSPEEEDADLVTADEESHTAAEQAFTVSENDL